MEGRRARGTAEEEVVVDQTGPRAVGEAGTGSVDGTAAERYAPAAGHAEWLLRRSGAGGQADGRTKGRGAFADEPSRNLAGHQLGLCAHAGRSELLCLQSSGGQLSGTKPGGGLQWHAAAAGLDQQAG